MFYAIGYVSLIYFVLIDIKDYFLDLVKTKLNITFANEQEIMALPLRARDFEEAITFAKMIKKLVVITRGKNGAIAIKDDKVAEECAAKKI